MFFVFDETPAFHPAETESGFRDLGRLLASFLGCGVGGSSRASAASGVPRKVLAISQIRLFGLRSLS